MARDRLRNETLDVHRRVDRAIDRTPVCVGPGAWRVIRFRALGRCGPVERPLVRFAWQAAGREFMPRCRVPMLRPDLRGRGVGPTTLQQLDPCSALRPSRALAA